MVKVSLGLPSKWAFHLRHVRSGIRTGPIYRKGGQIDEKFEPGQNQTHENASQKRQKIGHIIL